MISPWQGLALAAAVVMITALAPVQTSSSLRSACRIEGWSIDPDPAGLRVRAAPSKTAHEVGRLPAFIRDPDGDYGPAFDIIAAHDGWLRISGANDHWRPSDLAPRQVFSGVGWVHGSRVRLAVQSGVGRAAPKIGAEVVVDSGDQWLTDAGTISAVTDCAGGFAKLRYRLPLTVKIKGLREGEAWFSRTCGDQRTTCDLPSNKN